MTDIKRQLEQVVKNVKDEVKAEIEVIDKRVETVLGRLEQNEKLVEDLRINVTKQTQVTKDINLDLIEFNKMMQIMGEKVVDLEARGRRNNLILHGIPEERDEDCLITADRFFRENCKLAGSIPIQRAHRLGGGCIQRRPGPRPLIVLFVDYRDKENVKQSRRNLPASMQVTDDIPWEVRMARKELQDESRELFDRGQRPYIAYPARLICNGREIRRVTPRFTPQPRHGLSNQQHHGFGRQNNGSYNRSSNTGASTQRQQQIGIDTNRQPHVAMTENGARGPIPTSGIGQVAPPTPGVTASSGHAVGESRVAGSSPP